MEDKRKPSHETNTSLFIWRQRAQNNFWVPTLGLGTETWHIQGHKALELIADAGMEDCMVADLDMASGQVTACNAVTRAPLRADLLLQMCSKVAAWANDPESGITHARFPDGHSVRVPCMEDTRVVAVNWIV